MDEETGFLCPDQEDFESSNSSENTESAKPKPSNKGEITTVTGVTKNSRKRKNEDDGDLIKVLTQSILQRANKKSREEKNCAAAMFGNFVTESLLEMDPTTRQIAQNQISNVIFQAQMGYLGQDHGAMNYSQPNKWVSSGFQASTGMNHFGQSGCWTQRAQHQSSQLFNGPRVSTELSQKATDDLNEHATKDQSLFNKILEL